MPYLLRRNGLYYFNFRISKTLIQSRPELRVSLRTGDKLEAQFLAATLGLRLNRCIRESFQQSPRELTDQLIAWLNDLQPDKSRPKRSSSAEVSQVTSAALTLSQCFERYLEEAERAGLWSIKSKDDVIRAVENCIEIVGNIPIDRFSMTTARRYKEELQLIPTNREKLPALKGKTLKQIQALRMDLPTISPVTVNNQIRKVKALLSWCQGSGLIATNPLEQMKVIVPRRPKEQRLSFSQADLELIFFPSLFQYRESIYPWRYWIPMIALCTGARLEEISQLRTNDILVIDDLHLIRINDDHPDQHLKNPASRRVVPLSNALLQLGFMEYLEGVKSKGYERVFPELVKRREQYGHAVSKWFSRYKRRQGIIDDRKTFHSFRHGAVDVLRESGFQDSVIQCLLGHSTSTVTFDIYGSRAPLTQLQQAVEALSKQLESCVKEFKCSQRICIEKLED